MFFGVGGEHSGKVKPRRKENRSELPALHMEFLYMVNYTSG